MKKKLFIGGAIIIFIVVMVVLNQNKSEDSNGGFFSGGNAQQVEATIATSGDITSSILVTGAVKEVTKKEIMATASLKVTGVMVEVGDTVSEGDLLYTVDLSSMEEELIQLRLNREIQALQLEKVQSVATTSSATGAKIALELAKLNVTGAEGLYNSQVESLEKNRELFNEGIISSNELEMLEKSVNDAKSQVDIARLNFERSESDLNQLYSANNSSSKSLEIDIAIQLKNLEGMDLNITKIEKQMIDITEATKATISGTVTFKGIETGDITMTNTRLFQIMDMNDLIVVANVREYDIRQMNIGQEIIFTGDAISDDVDVKGKLSYIAPVASSVVINGRQTTGIEIKMSIDAGIEYLKPGFTTDCEITTESVDNVVIGNFNMFKEDIDNNKIAYVVIDNVIEERKIETGIASDFEMEIISGVESGDIIVVNPSFALKDGMKVEITNDLESTDDLENMSELEEEGK